METWGCLPSLQYDATWRKHSWLSCKMMSFIDLAFWSTSRSRFSLHSSASERTSRTEAIWMDESSTQLTCIGDYGVNCPFKAKFWWYSTSFMFWRKATIEVFISFGLLGVSRKFNQIWSQTEFQWTNNTVNKDKILCLTNKMFQFPMMRCFVVCFAAQSVFLFSGVKWRRPATWK